MKLFCIKYQKNEKIYYWFCYAKTKKQGLKRFQAAVNTAAIIKIYEV